MSVFLRTVGAGFVAAAISYVLNKILLPRFRKYSVIILTPVMEEGAKTFLALGFNASVVFTHTIFGLIEGAYDLFPFEEKKVAAFLVSLLSHIIFGVLTGLIFIYSSSWILSASLVSAVHVLWNFGVIKILKSS